MQPLDPDKKPKVNDPPLNHVGLWIDDLAAAVEWLTEAGVRFAPGGVRKGAAGYDVCFIHPKGNDSASSANSSPLVIVTRLSKSRWAMRLVPSWSCASGARLRRIWLTLSRQTTIVHAPSTSANVAAKSVMGRSTAQRSSLSTKVQSGAPNTVDSEIGQ